MPSRIYPSKALQELQEALDEIVRLKREIDSMKKVKVALDALNRSLTESEAAWRDLALKRGNEIERLKGQRIPY